MRPIQILTIFLFLFVVTLFAGSEDRFQHNDLLYDELTIFPEDRILYQEHCNKDNNSPCVISSQSTCHGKYSLPKHNAITKSRYLCRDLIWMNQVKVVYTYDVNNNLVSYLRQFWQDSSWDNTDYITYSYDANNNNISSLNQTWIDSVWMDSYRSNYTYDVNNNQISDLSERWNGSSWENQMQYYFSYDANNNRIGQLIMNWDGSDWINLYQIIYAYDASNNMTLYMWQDWDGNEWVNDNQRITAYNANNNWISQLIQNWVDSTWINNSLSSVIYDSNNNQIERLVQNWDGTNWVNNNMFLSTFDINNNLTVFLSQNWVDTEWEDIRQIIRVYDTNNNQTLQLWQYWDGSSWGNYRQTIFNYDINNNTLSWFTQNWDENSWVNDSQNLMTYDANNNRTSLVIQYWVNTTPVISPIPDQVINEDQTLTLQLSVDSDLSNASLTFSAFSDTSAILLTIDTTSLTITPEHHWNGTSQITVTVMDNIYMESDTTFFTLNVTPVNDPPTPIVLIYPAFQDTFSTHIDSDTSIIFVWNGGDVDSEISYHLTIFLEFFGNTYFAEYQDITDTTYNLRSNSLDALLAGLSFQESEMSWYLETTDGEYSVVSDTGSFYLRRELLNAICLVSIPTAYSLYQNYPNPFNPITTIQYDLPNRSDVQITIYNLLGRDVATLVSENQDVGYKSVQWDATNNAGQPVSAGMYFYQIRAGEFVLTRKMILIK